MLTHEVSIYLEPLEILQYWISERESIRAKKAAGLPKPWTDDVILQRYRFCNVRRMDDAVSQWLLKNWYKRYKDHPNMLVACCIARFFNLPETLAELTELVFVSGFNNVYLNEIKKRLRKLKKSRGTIFNGAYMVRGNDGKDKIATVIDHTIKPLLAQQAYGLQARSSMERLHEWLNRQYGFGSFMAGQVVADLRHAVSGSWRDKRTWAPMGPGSRRGMNRILGHPLNTPMNQDEFLVNLRSIASNVTTDRAFPRRLWSGKARWELMDLQNCLCEVDKYMRILYGEGKPKQRYPGT